MFQGRLKEYEWICPLNLKRMQQMKKWFKVRIYSHFHELVFDYFLDSCCRSEQLSQKCDLFAKMTPEKKVAMYEWMLEQQSIRNY